MKLTVALCGDIMMGAEVDTHMANASVSDWLAGISEAWSGADLVIGNLESPCVLEAKAMEGPAPELIFRAPLRRLAELAEAGFSAVTLANNHILNCGHEGLLETIRGLDQAGIYHAGAGMNLAEALQPALIPVQGMTIGLVAFCYGPLVAGRFTPGVTPCEPKAMRKALSTARSKSDLVVAAVHDGLEYSDVPPTKTRARFRFLAENGADIIFGHHPHVLQGLKWYKGVPIAYSLGDLLFHNSLPHVTARNFARIAVGRFAPEVIRQDPYKFSRGAVLEVHVSGKQKSVSWHPFRQDQSLRPQLSAGNTKIEDLRCLENLSGALGDAKDPRHVLIDSIVNALRSENLRKLGIREVMKLAFKPKWRYWSNGLRWLCQRTNLVR